MGRVSTRNELRESGSEVHAVDLLLKEVRLGEEEDDRHLTHVLRVAYM